MIKLSETPAIAADRYETLDIHRERALPTDVIIDREELVKLLKDVHQTTRDYKVGYKLHKELIQNIAGTQPEGHPKQGERLSNKDLANSAITMEKYFTYIERTELARSTEKSYD